MVRFIEFEATIDTFDGVRENGFAAEQKFKPKRGVMRDLYVTRARSDRFSKVVFYQILRALFI